MNTNIFVSYLCELFNDCINKCILPDILQHVNNTLVFKKVLRASKENYRPLTTLPCVLKLPPSKYTPLCQNFSETAMLTNNFTDLVLLKYQCGFRKGFSVPDCLLAMFKKRKSLNWSIKSISQPVTWPDIQCLWY